MESHQKTIFMEIPETDTVKAESKLSPFGRFFRFFASWFGFTGLYAAFTVCPFCGQQGCPVGIASAGTVGAFLALCIQDWRRFFRYVRSKMKCS